MTNTINIFQLMRTALHYAMGVDRVETLSKILIQAGAARVVKDLVSKFHLNLIMLVLQFKIIGVYLNSRVKSCWY